MSCNNVLKKFSPYNTLHVNIPQTSANLSFYFMPNLAGERIFLYNLQNLSLIEDEDEGMTDTEKA
jgi:hypothetical protein